MARKNQGNHTGLPLRKHMKYDHDKHHRRSIRLKGYDYSEAGAYFVTSCTQNRECLFGDVEDGEIRLNEAGQMVSDAWHEIPEHFPYAGIDTFVVMPNHFHGIIVLSSVGRGMACHAPTHRRFAKPIAGSLSTIIGSFKSAITKQINQILNTPGHPLWQRNYYEHVIRNDNEMDRMRKYITDNPAKWAEDEDNPTHVIRRGGSRTAPATETIHENPRI